MKGILKFDLYEDKTDFDMAVNASKAFQKLYEIDDLMRSILKYDAYKEKDKFDIADMVRDLIREDGLFELIN